MMKHYFPDDDSRPLYECSAECSALVGPAFVGQGLSRHVGSDCHGYFIVSIAKAGNKYVVGIVHASTELNQASEAECVLPNKSMRPEQCAPDFWITNYGKNRDGTLKWWKCDCNGKRRCGEKMSFQWNGAYEYLDFSF